MKYHITLGHQTVLGACTFFYTVPEESKLEEIKGLDEETRFGFFGELTEEVKQEIEFVYNSTHKYSDKLPKKATKPGIPPRYDILPIQARIYALIFFDAPVMCTPINSLLIGSKLDTEIERNE